MTLTFAGILNPIILQKPTLKVNTLSVNEINR